MAAPSNKTIRDLGGIWVLNKALSDDGLEKVLIIQGVPWLLRRAIAFLSITTHLSQNESDGVVTITIRNTSSGGIKETTEIRHLDWQPTEHKDYIWGHVKGSSRYLPTKELDNEFLKTGWLEETLQGECIQNDSESWDGSWSSSMVWGFELINGERRHVRHITACRGQETATAKLVYNYGGPVK